MTQYPLKSFTVPTGSRKPEECGHGWWTDRSTCVLCGIHVSWVDSIRRYVGQPVPPTPEEQEP